MKTEYKIAIQKNKNQESRSKYSKYLKNILSDYSKYIKKYEILEIDSNENELSQSEKIVGNKENKDILSMYETIKKSQETAKNVYENAKELKKEVDYSIGMEYGFFGKSILYLVCVFCVYDGKNYIYERSREIQLPKEISDKILNGESSDELLKEYENYCKLIADRDKSFLSLSKYHSAKELSEKGNSFEEAGIKTFDIIFKL